MVSGVVPEECAGGALNVCVRVVLEAAGVVPEVVRASASALVPVAGAPDPVAVCEAVAETLAETLGVASAVGAASFLAALAASLVALTQ